MNNNPYNSIGDFPTEMDSNHLQTIEVDRYQIIRELGRGAFGIVYLATDTISQQQVALKTLPLELNHSATAMDDVRKNFQLISDLHHPHIAAAKHLHQVENVSPGQDIQISASDYLLIMEYVDASMLSNWRLQFNNRKVPLDQALDICSQVADALTFAHSRNIIHRDIKPGNIMVDKQNQVKVLDFGLAAEISPSIDTVSGEKCLRSGTRPYMPPEQLLGSQQNSGTDQYALAIMFYELISGRVPFHEVFESNDFALICQIASEKAIPPLDELNDAQNEVLLKALAKKSCERYSSCNEFIKAFQMATQKPLEPTVQTNKKSPIWIFAVAALAIVAIYFFATKDKKAEITKNTNEQKQDKVIVVYPPEEKPKTTISNTDNQTRGSISQIIPLRNNAELLKSQLRTAQIPLNTTHKLHLKTAADLARAKDYNAAQEHYQLFINAAEKSLSQKRDELAAAKFTALQKAAEEQRAIAQKTEADQTAEKFWSAAESTIKEAKKLANDKQFDAAEEKARLSNDLYQKATKTAAPIFNQKQMRKAIVPVSQSTFTNRLSQLAPGSMRALDAQRRAISTTTPLEVKLKKSAIALRLIPSGSFTMGNASGASDQQPTHTVEISQKFYMGKFEISQEQWRQVMGSNPSQFSNAGPQAPVENISWNDAHKFLRKLEAYEGLPAQSLALPTEAQWEYACRAGTDSLYYSGDTIADLNKAAWHKGNSAEEVHPIGLKIANAFGLHDMHGNVWEWCSDFYSEYSKGHHKDPIGPVNGSGRVSRGGDWFYDAEGCTSSSRLMLNADHKSYDQGLRIVLKIPAIFK